MPSLFLPVLALGAVLLASVPGSAAAQALADHQYTSQDIEAGARVYSSQCALCHGPNGDAVTGIDLRRGRFRRAVTDEDLAGVIRGGAASGAMPGFDLRPVEMTAIVAFIRAGFEEDAVAVKVGNVARGQALYEGKGKCGSCHRVNGAGPRVAPDLSDIGAARTPTALQRAILDPTAAMWPINRPVRLVTKDGRELKGRRLNEDTYTVQIIDEQERLVSLRKEDLKTFELGKTSPMPSFAKTFSAEEVSDMVAYLLSLKGQP